MEPRYARGFNAVAKEELWERWRRGESVIADIQPIRRKGRDRPNADHPPKS